MDNSYSSIRDILYNEDISKLEKAVRDSQSSTVLHIIAYNYNWDGGFKIPTLIIENKNCDIGTALMIFFYADGYNLLMKNTDYFHSNSEGWLKFLKYTYEKIIKCEFTNQTIAYKHS